MNIPTSAKAPDRYQVPGGSDAVYLIEIATELDKARWRRCMRSLGARVWDRADMLAAARETITEISPPNASVLMAICDRYEALTGDTSADELAAANRAWSDLSRFLADGGGDFAAKWADNAFWSEVSPLIASRAFLVGKEGGPKLKRGADGLVPEEALADIPPLDRVMIGFRATALFSPSEAEAKNSASPQPSPSGPATSIAASEPQMDQPGISLANDTPATQN